MTYKRLFMTATKYNGDLGGFAGADAKCNLAAQGALLGGTWKAWIGDASTPPHTRITDVGPWYNISGETKLFNNVANLQTIPLSTYSSDFENEQGDPGTSVAAWSGHGSVSCLSWTSGASSQQGSYLSAGSSTMWQYPSLGCAQPLSIMCLEQ